MPITLTLPHNYTPRFYQYPFLNAVDNGCLRALCIWHRRAGKDVTFINLMARKAFERVGNYQYFLPTAMMARKILWEGINDDGFKFIDYLPPEIIARKSERDMLVTLINGSTIQLIGTDNLSIVGTNPVGAIFSEYSLQKPQAWGYIQPILRANGGWAFFNGTPRGYNHMYSLFKKTENDERWFTEILTVENTGAIDIAEIERDIATGQISRELANQEYWCSFEMGIEGSYYANSLIQTEQAGRIGDFEMDERYPVYTCWDLGIDNAMGIWFFQKIGRDFIWLEYYENSNQGLGHYAEVLKQKQEEKGYEYGNHFAPWDVKKRESNGITVQRNAEKVGLFFERVNRTPSVNDDIEMVRRNFSRFYFDEEGCSYGLAMLRDYHAKKDESLSLEGRPVFQNKPEHSPSSNCADSFRTGVRADELDLIKPSHWGAIGVRSYLPGKRNYIENKNAPKVPLWHTFGKKKAKSNLKSNYRNAKADYKGETW